MVHCQGNSLQVVLELSMRLKAINHLSLIDYGWANFDVWWKLGHYLATVVQHYNGPP